MDLVRYAKEMQTKASEIRLARKIIGFVPTMGALHEGHLSLIRIARAKADIVVVSIFVNPTQFGPNEDFTTYPRDLDRDKSLCEKENVDIVFAPDVSEMYPENYSTYVNVERLSDHLCGKSRPGHFRGVATVCTKLFNIVMPNIAVFGQKDAQQAFIIKRLVRDLNFNIEIIVAPIVREPDGLAMSSRNIFLNADERKEATALSRSLKLAEKLIIEDNVREAKIVINAMEELLRKEAPHGTIDYVSIVSTENLYPVAFLKGEILVAIAVKFSRARLIDNTIIKLPD